MNEEYFEELSDEELAELEREEMEDEQYERVPRRRRNRGMTNVIASAFLVFLAAVIAFAGFWAWSSKSGGGVVSNPTADAMNTQASDLLTQVVTGQQGALVAQPTSVVVATPVPANIPVSTLDSNGCVTGQVLYAVCGSDGSCQYMLVGSQDVFTSTTVLSVGQTATLCKGG